MSHADTRHNTGVTSCCHGNSCQIHWTFICNLPRFVICQIFHDGGIWFIRRANVQCVTTSVVADLHLFSADSEMMAPKEATAKSWEDTQTGCLMRSLPACGYRTMCASDWGDGSLRGFFVWVGMNCCAALQGPLARCKGNKWNHVGFRRTAPFSVNYKATTSQTIGAQ